MNLFDVKKLRVFLLIAVSTMLFIGLGYGYAQSQLPSVQLQGSLELVPVQTSKNNEIQPGTAVKIKAVIENTGDVASLPGTVCVCYCFAKPLQDEKGSAIYETEKKPLPAIEPHQSIEIEFSAPHKTPSVIDYVRDDWALREYQIWVESNQQKKLVGTLALTFSAYYYPGIVKKVPKTF